jgi:3-hydroxyisobutyrate dehydrogenase-like beta-hydroxyacid dehydrogenase
VGADARWLVVGHGSVGSFVADRLVARGEDVWIYDPEPRVALVAGRAITLSELNGDIRYIVSCVPPHAARDVPALLQHVHADDGLLLDWNTVSPATKRAIDASVPMPMVDVALLDTLDAERAHPLLAVSGPQAELAAALLEHSGFQVALVGAAIGDAAALKYLRSVFMKGLEALVLEYEALGSVLDGEHVVRDSLAASLGPQFLVFMDVLLRTDRVHAGRRSEELAGVRDAFGEEGWDLQLPAAAAATLRRAAQAWESAGAPPADAPGPELARHLGALWRS